MSQKKTPKDIGCQNRVEKVLMTKVDRMLMRSVKLGMISSDRVVDLMVEYVDGIVEAHERGQSTTVEGESNNEETNGTNIPINESDNDVTL